MPDWMISALSATPALTWVFLGLGLPWALVVLPRQDWRDRVMVATLTLAFGPALLTAWMFLLGSAPPPLLYLEWILAGTAIIAAVGWGLVWRKYRATPPLHNMERGEPNGDACPLSASGGEVRLALDEKLLILLVAAALVIRWLGVAYWPFTAYDALWVYGYEGRLYTLTHTIPATIGYYPQFLPLQYTFLQLATGGVINDHAARAVIPFLHLGSILAAYTLGHRLFSRRVGIYTAAIWALYPHVAEWSRFGDLEIPTTFLFTAAAAFFLLAWQKESPETSVLTPYQRRYAIIAGLLLGIGLWTKPTMGAFIWGVVALVVVDLARQFWSQRTRLTVKIVRQHPRFQIALWTAIACIPLGAGWYVRNIFLGHAPITMPTDFWPTLAARSGVEFGWPLLALLLLAAYVLFDYWVGVRFVVTTTDQPDKTLLRLPPLLVGLALVLVALLPSMNPPRRMVWTEYLVLTAGAGLLVFALQKYLRRRWPGTTSQLVWALLLALPYFITWFYSYSYHYRLSFPIVPLLLLPTALILARWTKRLAAMSNTRRRLITPIYLAALIVLSGPGIINALYDPNAGWDWLWTDKLPDDFSKYASGNPALMAVVNGLEIFEQDTGRPPVVVAPGIVRLPFFFPTAEIRTQTAPTRLSQLDGIDYFIYGMPETRGMYQTIPPQQNQVVSALALADYDSSDQLIRKAWWHDDGNFNYTVYELHLSNRFIKPENGVRPQEGEVVFGGFTRFLGHNIGGDYFFPGRKLIMNLFWEVLAPPPEDYMVYIHLRDREGKVWDSWDGPITRSLDGNYYSTLVWEPGEFLQDKRELILHNADVPLGEKAYHITIGLYNLETGARVPMTINGEPAGDGYTIAETLSVRAEEGG